MRSRRLIGFVLGLALAVGLVGVTYVAMAQVSNPTNTAAVAEYEKRLKAADRTKADDLFGLAKWCYLNGLTGEAKALSLEVLQKFPDDMRAKYLLYIMAAGSEKTDIVVERPMVEPEAGITEAEADAIYAREGDAIRSFPAVQRLLLTSCGAKKCHGGQNPQAKWSLISRDPASKKTVAENFRTVNRYIDRDSLTTSKLFQMPTEGKKAGHPEIVLRGPTDPVYIKLLAWAKTLKTATAGIWDAASKSPPPPEPAPAPKTPAPEGRRQGARRPTVDDCGLWIEDCGLKSERKHHCRVGSFRR